MCIYLLFLLAGGGRGVCNRVPRRVNQGQAIDNDIFFCNELAVFEIPAVYFSPGYDGAKLICGKVVATAFQLDQNAVDPDFQSIAAIFWNRLLSFEQVQEKHVRASFLPSIWEYCSQGE
jgi:hypothetical protein